MRDIKFRAWDKSNKRWLSFDDGDNIDFDYTGLSTLGYWTMFFDYDETAIVIEQFTGLRDKNGVEIYEGDIITLGGGILYSVEFEKGSFVCCHTKMKDWDGSRLKWGLLSRAFELTDLGEVEVIGNIHTEKKGTK